MMKTMDGYIEAGRQLKEKSNGEVYLSYIDPTSKTWRYWGRRGLSHLQVLRSGMRTVKL